MIPWHFKYKPFLLLLRCSVLCLCSLQPRLHSPARLRARKELSEVRLHTDEGSLGFTEYVGGDIAGTRGRIVAGKSQEIIQKLC